MDAVRSVPCDFFTVKLLVWDGSHQLRSGRAARAQTRADASAETTQTRKKGCSLVIDMRPYHTYKGTYTLPGKDIWEHDPAMQWERKRRHGIILGRLERFEALIVKHCKNARYGDRGRPRHGEEDEDEESGEEYDGQVGDADDDFVELIELDDEADGDYVEA